MAAPPADLYKSGEVTPPVKPQQKQQPKKPAVTTAVRAGDAGADQGKASMNGAMLFVIGCIVGFMAARSATLAYFYNVASRRRSAHKPQRHKGTRP